MYANRNIIWKYQIYLYEANLNNYKLHMAMAVQTSFVINIIDIYDLKRYIAPIFLVTVL